ncbi:MAG: hypothetical protein RL065_2063 [Bacteroidota bacterium]|jgi:uncharacterized protein YbjT (DUF2867 family)
MKTTVLIGASGLIGNYLLEKLLAESSYQNVIILVRRLLPIQHPKLQQIVVDFNDVSILKQYTKGEDLFICTGTTIKKAGSQAAFKAIDFDLPLQIATIASKNKMKRLFMVSALGADSTSSIFYSKIKGELEDSISKLNFQTIVFFQPSLLLGDRKEFRFWEKVSQIIFPLFDIFLIGKLKKYRAIHANEVAHRMIHESLKNEIGVRKILFHL